MIPRIRTFALAVLLLPLVLTGCGGDSSGPKLVPDIAGVWDVSMNVNEVQDTYFSGTITIVDASRKDPDFTGTFTMSLWNSGTNYGTVTGSLVSATVTIDGVVKAYLQDPSWRINGSVQNGSTMTGTWILSGDQNFSGSFTAQKR